MSDGGKSIFAKFVEDDTPKKEQQPVTIPRGPLLRPEIPPADHNSTPVAQLLHWLVYSWPGDTINARTIHWRGPNCARNRKSVLELTEILTAQGWLAEKKPRRRDTREWQIVRGPNR